MCYLDFRKAFDSVNHRLLLIKLESFSLAPGTLRWIREFLKDRRFRVSVEGSVSTEAAACSGVPQGSVLGPLLFLCYINDLKQILECPNYMFADDVKVVGCPSEATMQLDLDKIYQ